MRKRHMGRRSGLTLIEVLVTVALLVVFGVIAVLLAPYFQRGPSRPANSLKNSSQLRGIHQTAVIFSQANGFFLPGLDSNGDTLPDGPLTGFSGDGDTPAARFWILLDGLFIPPDMLKNPQELLTTRWTSGPLTTAHYSYAMSHIATEDRASGRRGEWKDNANSLAVFISDRNTGSSAADKDVRSLWTTRSGDWKGNLVWGDNHAEFATSHTGFTTRYLAVVNSNDHLFVDDPANPGANAYMVRE